MKGFFLSNSKDPLDSCPKKGTSILCLVSKGSVTYHDMPRHPLDIVQGVQQYFDVQGVLSNGFLGNEMSRGSCPEGYFSPPQKCIFSPKMC